MHVDLLHVGIDDQAKPTWKAWPRVDSVDEFPTISEFRSLWIAVEAIMQRTPFEAAAHHIFDVAKTLTGASSGYVELLDLNNTKRRVILVDIEGRPSPNNSELATQTRALSELCRTSGRAVYQNGFMKSGHVQYLPGTNVVLNNLMCTPLNDGPHTTGIMGLANKPGDISDHDAMLATHLAEMAALARQRTDTMSELIESVEKLEAFNATLVNREMRMIELKEQVNALSIETGVAPPYPEVWRDEQIDEE